MKKFVEDGHCGRVYFESKLGLGSTFFIEIPFEISDPGTISSGRVGSGIWDFDVNDNTAYDILLVEDNELNRKICCRFFENNKASYDVAENGMIAVEKVKAGLFNC